MGKASRTKGTRFERTMVNLCKDEGWPSERVPLSGAHGGSFAGDVRVMIGASWLTFEAKHKGEGKGFGLLYRWLSEHDGLFLKADHCEPLVAMPFSKFAALLKEAGGIS